MVVRFAPTFRTWLFVLALAIAVPARADKGVPQIAVVVDAVVETDVGTAIGFRCDHPDLLDVHMKTVGNHNVFVVKGVKVGKTLCRVGTEPQRPSQLFEVVVTAKPPAPRKK